ncbi:hypothetical protein [Pseudoclavibacter helvolus]|uniref:Putative membrane protein n=1 Tax=Pseudoclavibacter helvolus TaxID=255205 RepID=A0A7W4YDY9_9MICO|nr:hypothetical protein [Pseudoclavibacter helvolus]MBB2956974.1 putative membrane protein [Pseudoclavibacter helvolus]
MGARKKLTGHIVSGAAVVLVTKDASERYLYRGAPIPLEAFTDESVEHAISVGLVEEVYDEPTEDQAAAEQAAADAQAAAVEQAATDAAAAEAPTPAAKASPASKSAPGSK